MIHINDLSIVTKTQKTLISNLSLRLEQGRLYGLIGHNGSGKSTLIKALAGEYIPSCGEILLDGQNLQEYGAKELAKKLAYLPQKLPDVNGFSVEDLVMMGRYPHQAWLAKVSHEDHQVVQGVMRMTGILQFANQSVATMSGGERARAWLSMCLAQQTKYLLLDEPLAALDIVYQVEVLKLIRRLVDEIKMTVVIILHDINLAATYCDDIIAMKQGSLRHMDTVPVQYSQTPHKRLYYPKLGVISHDKTA